MGDPNGIGPEIALECAADERVRDLCDMRIVGCPEVLADRAAAAGLPLPADGGIIAAGGSPREKLVPGTLQAEAGRLAFEALAAAHAHAVQPPAAVQPLTAGKSGDAGRAIATAPWNKQAIRLAGKEHVGHTEALAALTGRPDPITIFDCGSLRIAFLTRHLPLADAVAAVRKDRITAFLDRLAGELAGIGIADPHIAVAALNPHAGDGGLLGKEETEEIAPAVEAARAAGLNVSGPVPADAVFHEGAEGLYDCVVALYHDQGHIAAKTRDFHGTVSLTLGLPYIRTSPDHGTAFDIAGQNRADPRSMIRAVELAAAIAKP
jgi:4-hydroxythreonine-4-phosphate dehydrogenase